MLVHHKSASQPFPRGLDLHIECMTNGAPSKAFVRNQMLHIRQKIYRLAKTNSVLFVVLWTKISLQLSQHTSFPFSNLVKLSLDQRRMAQGSASILTEGMNLFAACFIKFAI